MDKCIIYILLVMLCKNAASSFDEANEYQGTTNNYLPTSAYSQSNFNDSTALNTEALEFSLNYISDTDSDISDNILGMEALAQGDFHIQLYIVNEEFLKNTSENEDSEYLNQKNDQIEKEDINLFDYVSINKLYQKNDCICAEEDRKKFIKCLNMIENDYYITFIYLVNNVNRTRKYCSNNMKHNIYYNHDDDIFYNTMNTYLIKKVITNDICDNLNVIFKEYERMKENLFKLYNIDGIKSISKYFDHDISYIANKNSKKSKLSESILDLYIKMFFSENYIFLSKVSLGLNFINEVKRVEKICKYKVQIIKLLQIIICKFEAFRSNHFYHHQVQSNSFEDLKGNIQFNETILTINIMFKLILEICDVSFNILNVLE
ncbi:hypothetical protein H311_03574, partial [Anncaliia algerae PRA109]